MGDQGGGIESRGMQGNTRRLSEPAPRSHDDQIQPQSTQAETPSAEDEAPPKFPQVEPRNIHTTVNTSSQTNESLSRQSSNASAEWSEGRSKDGRRHIGRGTNNLLYSPRPLEPPVTKVTLSELDVNKIIHNPKLRHDINFDPELHFRPNLDGEKGRRKQDKAMLFWNTLSDQLQQFISDPLAFSMRFPEGEDWCLPLLLRSVKEIIQTLVPVRDRMYLDEGLNVDLIMQQFYRGVADLEKLASWLSGVLKSHCAPMRDEWVDEMYNQLTNGNRTNNMDELVQGLRSLLGVLEAMKLDVANHQIRCLRPILIEDTIHFEKRFFWKKIQTGKLDPVPAQHWYAQACCDCQPSHASRLAFGDMAVFFDALSSLVRPSHTDRLPNTFLFDQERMYKLRSDMLDAINLEICMRLYEEAEKKYRPGPTPFILTPSSSSEASQPIFTGSDEDFNFSRSPSRPASIVFSSSGSVHSSPRSLPVDASSAIDAKTRSRNLYNSLVALLRTSPNSEQTHERWRAMKDSLALQIFRFTEAPPEALLKFEEELELHLSTPQSQIFQQVEQYFHERLGLELQQRVKEFEPLPSAGLFSVATGGRIHGLGRTWDGSQDRTAQHSPLTSSTREVRDESGLEDMATRLTHLGLLHWRVWSELVYQQPAVDTEMSLETRRELD